MKLYEIVWHAMAQKNALKLFNFKGILYFLVLYESNQWRRGRDSNPRKALTFNGFQDRRVKPSSATPPQCYDAKEASAHIDAITGSK